MTLHANDKEQNAIILSGAIIEANKKLGADGGHINYLEAMLSESLDENTI